MFRNKLNLRKVVAIATCLAGSMTMFAQDSTTDPGVVINGVKWATRNVDAPGTFASAPEKGGMFYQWDRVAGWSITDPRVNSNGGTEWTSGRIVSPEREWKDTDPCPVGWRVPTETELRSLNETGSTWRTSSGVSGRLFGTVPNQIFLPAVGSRSSSDGSIYMATMQGCYWSSTRYPSFSNTDNSYVYWYLFFYSSNVMITPGHPAADFCVRCVADDTTGINDVSLEAEDITIVGYFDILGRKLEVEPVTGIYIIQYNNGKTKKMIK